MCRIIVLLVGFALAYGSWRFVETPFRQKKQVFRGAPVFAAAMTSIAAVLAVSLLIDRSDGLSYRYSPDVLRIADTGTLKDYSIR